MLMQTPLPAMPAVLTPGFLGSWSLPLPAFLALVWATWSGCAACAVSTAARFVRSAACVGYNRASVPSLLRTACLCARVLGCTAR